MNTQRRNKTFGITRTKRSPLAAKLFLCGIGRHDLVPASSSLRNGREQIGKWGQLLDPAYGVIILVANMWGIVLKE